MTADRPQRVVPHIFVDDAETALRFYHDAFGAVELFRNVAADGTIVFVELAVGEGTLLVSEEVPRLNALAPATVGGSPVLLTIQVADPGATVKRAADAGAEVEMPVEEMFWGERYGIIRDPIGHRWAVTTDREQLTPDEIAKRTPPGI